MVHPDEAVSFFEKRYRITSRRVFLFGRLFVRLMLRFSRRECRVGSCSRWLSSGVWYREATGKLFWSRSVS